MVRGGVCLCGLVAMLLIPTSARSEVLVKYDFTDNNAVADQVSGNVIASNFLAGAGLTSVSYVGSANARGWNPSSSAADALSRNDYWSFTTTATAGKVLDLTSLSFDGSRGNSGPTKFEIAVNGTLLPPAGSTGTSSSNYAFNLSAFSNLAAATIQFFGWNASNNGNSAQWFVDNVILSGSTHPLTADPDVSAVPLPSSLVLLGAGCVPMIGIIWLRRSRGVLTHA